MTLVVIGTMDLKPPCLDIASRAFIAKSPVGVLGSGLGIDKLVEAAEVNSPSKDAGGANISS